MIKRNKNKSYNCWNVVVLFAWRASEEKGEKQEKK
jgi:hypothetical protein